MLHKFSTEQINRGSCRTELQDTRLFVNAKLWLSRDLALANTNVNTPYTHNARGVRCCLHHSTGISDWLGYKTSYWTVGNISGELQKYCACTVHRDQ